MLTRSLKEALAMVDVKLLDHFIVAGNASPLRWPNGACYKNHKLLKSPRFLVILTAFF